MSAQPIDPPALNVLVAQTVLDRVAELAAVSPDQADSVARAIQDVGHAKAAPIRIEVKDGPPGAKYLALAPSDPDAPVVIYRAMIPQIDHMEGWLVAALITRQEYVSYQTAERAGLLNDPLVKILIAGGIAYLIWQAVKGQGGLDGA